MSVGRDRLRDLPKIDDLLRSEELASSPAPRWAVVEAARRAVESLRAAILDGTSDRTDVDLGHVARMALELARPSLRRVVNATGVVLHTNLGRAPLAEAAIEEMAAVAAGYSTLEYDLAAGKRGSRHEHLVEILCSMTGAEDVAVVNNCASAVMLGLAALAAGREVIVSRGELIEIGGSFRVPDVMRLSGARLVEVGTTNKTRAADYRSAIGDDTGMVLKVHRSNFAIVGFTEEARLDELVTMAREAGAASMIDLGSGLLIDSEDRQALGLGGELGVREAVAAGFDLVCFSGDKLLGGPQAGILAGKRAAVARARKHPLMRALRPDKLTISALRATTALYRDGRWREVPALAMFSTTREQLAERARDFIAAVGPTEALELRAIDVDSAVGGGALPLSKLASVAVSLGKVSGARVDAMLRAAPVAIVGRIVEDSLCLDMRTLSRQEDFNAAVEAVQDVAHRLEAG